MLLAIWKTGKIVTQEKFAAILVIGNEILSGRTRDGNIQYIAEQMDSIGISIAEARIVPDIETEIVAAVRALCQRYDYVFTTGGIGPTHDDITAESIAVAFHRALELHPEAMARLEAHYGADDFTPARQRMARIPQGASLIDNPVSVAPGFRIENVFVLPGVPKIMQPMLLGIVPTLQGGPKKHSITICTMLPESVLADGLAVIQADFPDVQIGSYPYMKPGQVGVSVVVRGVDGRVLTHIQGRIGELIVAKGGKIVPFLGEGVG